MVGEGTWDIKEVVPVQGTYSRNEILKTRFVVHVCGHMRLTGQNSVKQ